MNFYSVSYLEREQTKNFFEEKGKQAFKKGKQRWDNPGLTKQEKADMKEFAPWQPPMADRQDAYYWDIGWENEKYEN